MPIRKVRWLLTYLLVLGAGVVIVVLVLSAGGGKAPAPQLAQVTSVGPAAAPCLGPRLVAVQSGVYLNLHEPGPRGTQEGEGELGRRVGEGKVDRRSGVARLNGECRSAGGLAGQRLSATMQVTRAGTGSGTLHADGEPIALSLTPVDDPPPGEAGAGAPLTDGELAGRLFLAVAVVIVVSRFIGLLFTRVHQPRVMGEIVAGILLGPSLLGAFHLELSHFLFPPEVIEVLRMMAQFGLIFFMFLIGLELDTRLLRGSGHVAVLVSHVSIVLPFCLGAVASLLLFPLLGSGNYVGFTLFMGTAMAITAFPVLARILAETGLHRTRLGAVSITCAAVDDITAWCVLAVVVAIVKSAEAVDALRTISLALLFVGVMLLVVRPIATRLAVVHQQRGRLNPPIMAGLIVALFLSAWSTEQIGIHAIFGAFMLGAVVPRSRPLVTEITTKLEDVTVLFLLPVFFTVVGLSTRVGLLDRASLWMMAALVIFLAIVGKLAGSMIAARAAHQSWRDSTALGLLLNTRGLTEIVVLTIGRGLGVVSPALFTILVLMALVTTFMTTPLIALVYPRRVVELEAALAAAHGGSDRQPSPVPTQCVLVAVGDPLQARSLLSLVTRLALPSEPKPDIVLAHVTPPPGRDEVRTSLAALDDAADAARVELVPLAGELLGAGFDARVRVRASSEPAEELAQLAAGEGAQLVLLGRHRSYVGHNELGGVVRHTLERLGCDGAVLLDRPNHLPAQAFVAVWYRQREDLVALHLAARLAIGGGETLHVFQPPGQESVELTVPVPTVAVEATDVSGFVAAAASASLLVVSRWEAPDLSAVGPAGPPVLIVQPGSGRRLAPRGHKGRARALATTPES